MRKTFLLILILLLAATGAYAGPSISGGASGGGGVSLAADCSGYVALGQLCQDTGDGKLYKGTGAVAVEIAAGAGGDVVAASTAQTWGDGTGPVVWTFGVTGTDPTISVATAAFTVNTSLALGANNITMTGSLGATGAGRLTKGWFVDLDVTNAIAGSVTGNAATATALAANPTDCSAGELATGIAANGNLTCTASPTGLTSVAATTFTGALSGNASTATALAANPTDCGANAVATAIDASGNLTCGYAIGTNIQAYDADLTTWAGVTPGTGVATALAVNVGSAGAAVVNGGALGTPSSGTVTNLTGTASININGTVGATTPAAGAFTTLTASTSLAVTAATTTGGYIRLLEGTDNGTDYSVITGAANSGNGLTPSFTFSGSGAEAEDLSLTASANKWTIASSTGATVEITPATKITGTLTTGGTIELGAASDTTIQRSGAGTVTIEGLTIATVKPEKLATFAWDGGGSAVATTGSKRCVAIPYAAAITGNAMVISGDPGAGGTILNITKDAWSDSTLPTTEIDASAPPTVADNKVASTDSTLTGWTKTVAANDIICADVATNAVATWISLTIFGTK